MLKFRIPSRVYASNLKLGEMGTVQLQIASIRFDSFKVFTRILFFQTLNSLDKKALRGCIKSPIYQSHEQWSWKSYSFSHLLWINSRIFLFVSAKSNNNNPYWMLCPEIGIKMLHQMMFDSINNRFLTENMLQITNYKCYRRFDCFRILIAIFVSIRSNAEQ